MGGTRDAPDRPSAPAPSAPAVASPCVSLCRMHADTGWCEGCQRTLDEISAWSRLDDAGKRVVLQRLPARGVAWAALQAAALPPGATKP